MKTVDTFIALNRFGMGAAPGEADRIADDPRGWLAAQIGAPLPPLADPATAKSSADILRDIQVARRAGAKDVQKSVQKAYRQAFRSDLRWRASVMVQGQTPFADRMTLFWSNHFTVSTTKRIIGPATPAFEREAIRPHIFGRFVDMLIAVERHPVMLSYLDNAVSLGENSLVGIRRRRRQGGEKTINENLAREILELHTLGVDGGYSQNDVMQLALSITGWSHGGIRFRRDDTPIHGAFEFKPGFHEPGPKTVLGKTYAQDGPDQGLRILEDLARHPATAQFIATKLVRHFVADTPPPDAVEEIARVFQNTDGDLAAISQALIDLEAVWTNPLPKVKTPYELVIAAHRAVGRTQIQGRDSFRILQQLGHMPFSATSPAGWSDEARHWLSPEALMERISWLRRMAAQSSSRLIPAEVLEDTIGAVADLRTRDWVARAPSGDAGIAMILASPEFQRR